MIYDVCAICDLKARFLAPAIYISTAVAIRDFKAGLTQDPVNKYPEDFVLYRIGSYDDSNGVIIPDVPSILIHGREVYDE